MLHHSKGTQGANQGKNIVSVEGSFLDKSIVLDLLRNYRQMKARSEFLRDQIENTAAYIEELKRTVVEDSVHITANWNGLPHGNSISSPVEGLAVRLADGEYPSHITAEIHRLTALKKEYRELCSNVRAVDIWLQALTERQRFTVQQTFIEGHTWPETEVIYEQRYMHFCTSEGLRKTRQKALEIIYRIAE